jgi:sugar phosphate isomerase/epimerase
VPHPFATAPLSLAHLSELDVPPAELVDFAAAAGFSSIGLRTVAAVPGGREYPLRRAAEQAEMRRRMDAAGVSVLYIEMVSLSEETRVSDYRPALEVGAALGASRLAVAGDSTDFSVVAERLAQLSELAGSYGIAVDLEFMPFRPVQSFRDAVEVVKRARHPNAHILVDALHVFRSRSAPEELARADRALLGAFQICDAPRTAPAPDQLAAEARTRRLLPGEGDLPLRTLLDALPPDIPFGIEIPLAAQYPQLGPGDRLSLLVNGTRDFLNRIDA